MFLAMHPLICYASLPHASCSLFTGKWVPAAFEKVALTGFTTQIGYGYNDL